MAENQTEIALKMIERAQAKVGQSIDISMFRELLDVDGMTDSQRSLHMKNIIKQIINMMLEGNEN